MAFIWQGDVVYARRCCATESVLRSEGDARELNGIELSFGSVFFAPAINGRFRFYQHVNFICCAVRCFFLLV